MQELSTKTVRDIITILKAVLKFAEQEYKCSFKIKTIVLPKLEVEELKILNKRERNRLERYCIKNDSLRNLGILISLNTGLRIGEICALKWENISLEKRLIFVRSTLQRIYDKEQKITKIAIGTPKTRTSIRSIPISNKLYSILKLLKSKYNEDDFFFDRE